MCIICVYVLSNPTTPANHPCLNHQHPCFSRPSELQTKWGRLEELIGWSTWPTRGWWAFSSTVLVRCVCVCVCVCICVCVYIICVLMCFRTLCVYIIIWIHTYNIVCINTYYILCMSCHMMIMLIVPERRTRIQPSVWPSPSTIHERNRCCVPPKMRCVCVSEWVSEWVSECVCVCVSEWVCVCIYYIYSIESEWVCVRKYRESVCERECVCM